MKIDEIVRVMELFEKFEMTLFKYSVDGEKIVCSKQIYWNQNDTIEAERRLKTNDRNETSKSVYKPSSSKKEVIITADVIGIINFSNRIFGALGSCYVEAGEVVGTLEAMKLLHEIKSPVSGNLRVLVKKGVLLEFEQELFSIEMNGDDNV